jgi:hypothetical protein
MKYPIYFQNSQGVKVATISKYLSADKTPRYNVNPNSTTNTYSISTCMERWKPVYKFVVGDIVFWKDYKLEVIKVVVKDELIRCVGVNDGSKTICWKHWLNFSDVTII